MRDLKWNLTASSNIHTHSLYSIRKSRYLIFLLLLLLLLLQSSCATFDFFRLPIFHQIRHYFQITHVHKSNQSFLYYRKLRAENYWLLVDTYLIVFYFSRYLIDFFFRFILVWMQGDGGWNPLKSLSHGEKKTKNPRLTELRWKSVLSGSSVCVDAKATRNMLMEFIYYIGIDIGYRSLCKHSTVRCSKCMIRLNWWICPF